MKISVVIITKNEEDRIADAISSCREFADEILVVDSYSSDQTVEIARSLGARVLFSKFIDYGTQKNFALSQANNRWVLNLDADERASATLIKAIMHLKNSGDPRADGFLIKRKTAYLGRWIMHSGWYPDRKLRLFRKDISHWEGRVHERLVLDGKTRQLPGHILHYTYRDISDHISRINRYTTFQAQDLAGKGTRLLLLRALLLPGITFLRYYIWKLGVLDGFAGFIIAMVSSWGTAMKYTKARALNKSNKKENVS